MGWFQELELDDQETEDQEFVEEEVFTNGIFEELELDEQELEKNQEFEEEVFNVKEIVKSWMKKLRELKKDTQDIMKCGKKKGMNLFVSYL